MRLFKISKWQLTAVVHVKHGDTDKLGGGNDQLQAIMVTTEGTAEMTVGK